MSHQFSKKKLLVESIKHTMNKPAVNVNKNKTVQPSNYSSYLNTAIDYTKDHSVTPYLERQNQVIYDLDSDSPEGQNQQNVPDYQQLYDDEIMNEIEMQIYSETKKQEQQTNNQHNIEIYEEEENISYEEPKQKVNKTLPIAVKQRQKRKVSLKYNNLYEEINFDEQDFQPQNGSHTAKTQKKWTQDYDQEYQEAKIIEEDQQPINKPKKHFMKPAVQEPQQPIKKLNVSSNIQQPKRFVNFSIDIKPLNTRLKIKSIKKCLTDGKAIKRQDAQYLVELDNEKKEQKVVGNTELIHFYKNQLIQYYQTLHFQ